MGNSFTLLVASGIILTAIGLIFKRPLLYLFGASDITYPYADAYMTIYLLGSVFVMIGLGMNAFVNSQGFARIGMLTVLLGAVANLILDPSLFSLSIWACRARPSRRSFPSLCRRFGCSFPDRGTGDPPPSEINAAAGKTAGKEDCFHGRFHVHGRFYQQPGFHCLQFHAPGMGGDLYVGVMTVLHSVREIAENLVKGLTNGTQPFLGFNYGAESMSGSKRRLNLCRRLRFPLRWYADPDFHFPGVFYPYFQSGAGSGGGGGSVDPRVLFRLLLYVSAVCGAGQLCRSWKGPAGHLLFHFPEGYYRGPVNASASLCGRTGSYGRLPRGAGVQLDRRRRMLRNDALYDMAGVKWKEA